MLLDEVWDGPTWVHLTVGGNTISINEVLEANGKLVGAMEGWWHHVGGHTVDDWLN